MKPEEIAAILQKAVDSSMAPKPEQKSEDIKSVLDAVSNLGKAVSAINDRVENLDKTAVKAEVKTPETQIEAIAKTVADLAAKVENIGKDPDELAKNEKIGDITKGDLMKMIADAVKPSSEKPTKVKGKGKDADLGKTADTDDDADDSDDDGDSSDEGKEEPDLDGIETEDVNGNELSKNARVRRAELDDFFGKAIGKGQKFADSNDDDDDDE